MSISRPEMPMPRWPSPLSALWPQVWGLVGGILVVFAGGSVFSTAVVAGGVRNGVLLMTSLLLMMRVNLGEARKSLWRWLIDFKARDVPAIGIALALALLATFAVQLALKLPPIELAPEVSEMISHPVFLVLTVTLAPIAEEVWFRGLFFGSLQRYGTGVAVAVSVVICGLAHWPPAHIVGALPAILMVTWLRVRTTRLMPSIIAHVAWNGGVVLLELIAPLFG